MNESKLKGDYQNINKNIIDKIAHIIKDGDITDEKNKDIIKEYLSTSDYNYCSCIGEYIASLFGVDKCDILSKDKSINLVHARSLWFNAMRFMMRKSYREIAVIISLEDVSWGEATIADAVRRVEDELKTNIDLRYKWDMIKKLIYLGKNPTAYDENPFSSYKVKVIRPKNVEIEIVEE